MEGHCTSERPPFRRRQAPAPTGQPSLSLRVVACACSALVLYCGARSRWGRGPARALPRRARRGALATLEPYAMEGHCSSERPPFRRRQAPAPTGQPSLSLRVVACACSALVLYCGARSRWGRGPARALPRRARRGALATLEPYAMEGHCSSERPPFRRRQAPAPTGQPSLSLRVVACACSALVLYCGARSRWGRGPARALPRRARRGALATLEPYAMEGHCSSERPPFRRRQAPAPTGQPSLSLRVVACACSALVLYCGARSRWGRGPARALPRRARRGALATLEPYAMEGHCSSERPPFRRRQAPAPTGQPSLSLRVVACACSALVLYCGARSRWGRGPSRALPRRARRGALATLEPYAMEGHCSSERPPFRRRQAPAPTGQPSLSLRVVACACSALVLYCGARSRWGRGPARALPRRARRGALATLEPYAMEGHCSSERPPFRRRQAPAPTGQPSLSLRVVACACSALVLYCGARSRWGRGPARALPRRARRGALATLEPYAMEGHCSSERPPFRRRQAPAPTGQPSLSLRVVACACSALVLYCGARSRWGRGPSRALPRRARRGALATLEPYAMEGHCTSERPPFRRRQAPAPTGQPSLSLRVVACACSALVLYCGARSRWGRGPARALPRRARRGALATLEPYAMEGHCSSERPPFRRRQAPAPTGQPSLSLRVVACACSALVLYCGARSRWGRGPARALPRRARRGALATLEPYAMEGHCSSERPPFRRRQAPAPTGQPSLSLRVVACACSALVLYCGARSRWGRGPSRALPRRARRGALATLEPYAMEGHCSSERPPFRRRQAPAPTGQPSLSLRVVACACSALVLYCGARSRWGRGPSRALPRRARRGALATLGPYAMEGHCTSERPPFRRRQAPAPTGQPSLSLRVVACACSALVLYCGARSRWGRGPARALPRRARRGALATLEPYAMEGHCSSERPPFRRRQAPAPTGQPSLSLRVVACACSALVLYCGARSRWGRGPARALPRRARRGALATLGPYAMEGHCSSERPPFRRRQAPAPTGQPSLSLRVVACACSALVLYCGARSRWGRGPARALPRRARRGALATLEPYAMEGHCTSERPPFRRRQAPAPTGQPSLSLRVVACACSALVLYCGARSRWGRGPSRALPRRARRGALATLGPYAMEGHCTSERPPFRRRQAPAPTGQPSLSLRVVACACSALVLYCGARSRWGRGPARALPRRARRGALATLEPYAMEGHCSSERPPFRRRQAPAPTGQPSLSLRVVACACSALVLYCGARSRWGRGPARGFRHAREQR